MHQIMKYAAIHYISVLISVHITIILLEYMYRHVCFPIDNVYSTMISVITRHSSVCIALHDTIHTIDSILKEKILHIIGVVVLYIKN